MRQDGIRKHGRLTYWLSDHRAALLVYVVVVVAYVVLYVATIRSRPLYVPDSQYYFGMSLWYGGMSQEDAHAAVVELTRAAGLFDGEYRGPSLDQMFNWGLVQPRVVLPLLAAPLVKAFGVAGIAVVTFCAGLALFLLLTRLIATRYGLGVAFATVMLTISSTFILYFSVAMTTEGISALCNAGLVVLAWRYQRSPSRWVLVAMVAVVVVSAFTRQATLIAAGAFAVAYLAAVFTSTRGRDWLAPAVAVVATSLAVQLLQSVVFPSFSQLDQFVEQSGGDTLLDALLGIPATVRHVLVGDFNSAAVYDHALIVLVLVSLVSLVVRWRRPESHLLLGAILGIALYNITNGSSTSFRYALPGVVFFALAVAALMNDVTSWAHSRVREREQESGTPTSA